jgi:hypothetical protein
MELHRLFAYSFVEKRNILLEHLKHLWKQAWKEEFLLQNLDQG